MYPLPDVTETYIFVLSAYKPSTFVPLDVGTIDTDFGVVPRPCVIVCVLPVPVEVPDAFDIPEAAFIADLTAFSVGIFESLPGLPTDVTTGMTDPTVCLAVLSCRVLLRY